MIAPQPTTQAPASLLVVDDHDLLRLGLLSLVRSHTSHSERQIEVLESRTLQEALELYEANRHAIGLVLLDLHLPDAHGLSGLSTFRQRFPEASVVVLSGVNDPGLMRHCLSRGAKAYIPKSGDLKEVIDYIRMLGVLGPNTGVAPTPPQAAETVLRTVRGPDGQRLELTERQTEVLEWILSGQSNRDIASRAHLSEGTVKNHVSALLLLFGVRSRAQLISQLR